MHGDHPRITAVTLIAQVADDEFIESYKIQILYGPRVRAFFYTSYLESKPDKNTPPTLRPEPE